MKIINRKFGREYEVLEKFEAGIVLIGAEVKSVRAGHMLIDNAFVKILGSEAYLINANIAVYPFSQPQGYDPKRTRKLLLHKKELLRIQGKLSSGSKLTVVPIACYNKGINFKMEVALVKGRSDREKTKLVKGKTIERNQKREVKEYMRS